jgi:hypothetical protein
MTQPPARDSGPAPQPGRRPPEYVIVTWASEQLRDLAQRTGLSLAEALRAGDAREPGPRADPEGAAVTAPKRTGGRPSPRAGDHAGAATARTAWERVSAARSAQCPCQTQAGAPCTPSGDHLARYLRAWQGGTLSRESLKHAIDGLDVIASQAIVPAPAAPAPRPQAAANGSPAEAEPEAEPG